MAAIKGFVKKGRLTKRLIEYIDKNSIPVISHRAIDLVAAQDLKHRNVKAVINCEPTVDGKYNLDGVIFLLDNNIKLFDVCESDFFDTVNDGDTIRIDSLNNIYVNGKFHSKSIQVKTFDVGRAIEKRAYDESLRRSFIKNTIFYMMDELDYYLKCSPLPEIGVDINGRDVLIVSRGRNYRDDLKAIKGYIKLKKPVIISVDGGADAVIDMGLKSDIIIGDMDSVTDRGLLCCKEVLVQSYSDGNAPGLDRIVSLGLKCKLLPLKGTSEDAAIYLALHKGASMVYLIGGHLSADEFLEKGRPGMGSTALIRILLGSKITDLKGVSSVYRYNNSYYSACLLVIVCIFMCYMLFSYTAAAKYIHIYLEFIF